MENCQRAFKSEPIQVWWSKDTVESPQNLKPLDV